MNMSPSCFCTSAPISRGAIKKERLRELRASFLVFRGIVGLEGKPVKVAVGPKEKRNTLLEQ